MVLQAPPSKISQSTSPRYTLSYGLGSQSQGLIPGKVKVVVVSWKPANGPRAHGYRKRRQKIKKRKGLLEILAVRKEKEAEIGGKNVVSVKRVGDKSLQN